MRRVRDQRLTSDRQTAAAEVLARGGTVSQAAKAAGVSARTVFRWKNSVELRTLVRDLLGPAALGLVPKAVKTLGHVLDHGNDRARILAAAKVLEMAGMLQPERESPTTSDGASGILVVPRKNAVPPQ